MTRTATSMRELAPTSARDVETAAAAATALTEFLHTCPITGDEVVFFPNGGARGEAVAVPRMAFEMFVDILSQMAAGNAVTILPIHAEITTQQAADLLNVSRPFLVKLLESRQLPYRKVGTRRRVRLKDLLEYKKKDDAARTEVADELAREAQRLGLDY